LGGTGIAAWTKKRLFKRPKRTTRKVRKRKLEKEEWPKKLDPESTP